MTTPNLPRNKLAAAVAGAMEFKGFEDWFEIFEGGKQTDSKGRTQTFSEADLDTIVANHQPAPLVFGHPQTNDPAYGWVHEVKRDGLKLLAKAKDVAPEFAAAVAAKHFPKRSSSLEVAENGGLRLRHVGFLGAVKPAVSTLADLDFVSDFPDSLSVYEYAISDTSRVSWGLDGVARIARSLRDFFIEQFGLETADRVLPDYHVTDIQHQAAELRDDPMFSKPTDNKTTTITQKPEAAMPDVKNYSQEDVDAAVAAAKSEEQKKLDATAAKLQKLEFKSKLDAANLQIEQLVKDGKLLPAQKIGLAEFMASLSTDKDAAFEFSASADEKESKTPFEFMTGLLAALQKQVVTGTNKCEDADNATKTYSAPAGFIVNQERADLHQRALNYSAEKGVSYIHAINVLEQE